MRDMLADCGLADWCGPATRALCRIQVERQLIPISDLIELQVGSLLEVLVTLQHAEDEDVSFLQERPNHHVRSQPWTFDSVDHPHVLTSGVMVCWIHGPFYVTAGKLETVWLTLIPCS